MKEKLITVGKYVGISAVAGALGVAATLFFKRRGTSASSVVSEPIVVEVPPTTPTAE